MMSEHLIISVDNHIGRITLNRPQSLNALTLPMIQTLQIQLDLWEMDEHIHAVVVDAVLGRAFCAGGDVRFLYDKGRDDLSTAMSFFWHEYRLNYTIHQYKKPYIVLMNGVTMGGGVGIALHGKYTIASEHFTFAMPETAIGFFPDIGSSYLLSRCKHHIGMYLGLTGARLKAAEALRLELIHAYVPHESFPSILNALVHADLSVQAHKKVEETIACHLVEPDHVDEGLRYTQIEACFNQSTLLEIMQALVLDGSAWARETHQALLKKSPLSLFITHALLLKAQTKTLKACLTMDYTVAYHCLKHADFYEGVRAVLIDKDNTPHWDPKSLERVTLDDVEAYFHRPDALDDLLL